ncbi:hypothetical protein [Myxococcus phage Mx1]|nr:hypothetical protein [Myxococcus phage Mx1]
MAILASPLKEVAPGYFRPNTAQCHPIQLDTVKRWGRLIEGRNGRIYYVVKVQDIEGEWALVQSDKRTKDEKKSLDRISRRMKSILPHAIVSGETQILQWAPDDWQP